jgi:hypothetical protein
VRHCSIIWDRFSKELTRVIDLAIKLEESDWDLENRTHREDVVSVHGLANRLDMVYTCTDLHDSKSIAAENRAVSCI